MKRILSHLSGSFTRPADTTAYTAGDLVANSTTAGSVVAIPFIIPVGNGKGFSVRSARIKKSGTSATLAQFSLHLYGASPTAANGDNGAWSTTLSSYIGKIAFAVMDAFSDGAAAVNDLDEGSSPSFVISDGVGKVYGLIVADAGYTPASAEVFTVELEIEQ